MREVTTAQMKELERRADAAGLSYRQMMENAGAAAAQALLAHLPSCRAAAVLCGRGNNGGDGFVVARLLHEAGVDVLIVPAEGPPATPDAAENRERTQRLGIHTCALEDLGPQEEAFIARADALVDAVYGTGFHGALRPAGARAAAILNRGRFVLALDLPSGLCADTGAAAGGAVHAQLTVTFHAPKPCHRLAAGLCGRVVTADIGIGAALGGSF